MNEWHGLIMEIKFRVWVLEAAGCLLHRTFYAAALIKSDIVFLVSAHLLPSDID